MKAREYCFIEDKLNSIYKNEHKTLIVLLWYKKSTLHKVIINVFDNIMSKKIQSGRAGRSLPEQEPNPTL